LLRPLDWPVSIFFALDSGPDYLPRRHTLALSSHYQRDPLPGVRFKLEPCMKIDVISETLGLLRAEAFADLDGSVSCCREGGALLGLISL
jgi:hypothetical protein